MTAVLTVAADQQTEHAPVYKLGRSIRLWHGCTCRPGYFTSPHLPALHAGQDPDVVAGTVRTLEVAR